MNCCIGLIHENCLIHMPQLEKLDISKNLLESMKANTFKDLRSLKELVFNDCSNEMVVYLKYPIDLLVYGLFFGLYRLEQLYLNENSINHLNLNAFRDLRSLLKVINLNLFDISNIPKDSVIFKPGSIKRALFEWR